MSLIQFNCPRCTQHIEAPEGIYGQMASCPSCNHSWTVKQASIKRNTKWIGPMIMLIICICVFPIASLFASQAGTIAVLIYITVGVLGIYAAFTLAYLKMQWIGENSGLVLMLVGLMILLASLFSGAILGVIAGGFIAVIGTILFVAKKYLRAS